MSEKIIYLTPKSLAEKMGAEGFPDFPMPMFEGMELEMFFDGEPRKVKITNDAKLDGKEVGHEGRCFRLDEKNRELFGKASLRIESALNTLRDGIAAGQLTDETISAMQEINEMIEAMTGAVKVGLKAQSIRSVVGLDDE